MTQLLKDTGRLDEAEPLARLGLALFIRFRLRNSYPHPHLNVAVANYRHLLAEMGLSPEEIEQRLQDVAAEAREMA